MRLERCPKPGAAALVACAALVPGACGPGTSRYAAPAPTPSAMAPETPRTWQGVTRPPPLIPAPRHVSFGTGTLVLLPGTGVVVEPADEDLRALVDGALAALRVWTGLPLPVRLDAAGRAGDVRVRLGAGGPPADPATTGLGRVPTRPGAWNEGYQLTVDADGARVEAEAVPGILHGLRTLDQLAAADGRVPYVAVDDAPRFGYRGLHLDVGRHVFPVAFVLRYVDLLARYKLNAFHWHLTEDQGWRVEIRSRPRLQSVAAFRHETRVGHASEEPYAGDGRPYGGYYTQDEIRRVVAYAAERGVTVIPEIELPGHARAAIAAYPELGCDPDAVEVATTWGVFEEIYCPSESTFRFLEDVLDEVLALFPSELIHIGGDEAPKAAWERSPVAQEVIRREGLADEHELQSWFIGRVGTWLRARGRRLIGWDEILEGGLAADATVMSWRGEAGGIEAARQGHDVIMTPNDVVYLDHYQGDPAGEPLAIGGLTTLDEIYGWEPVPAALDLDEAAHVLGGQGNVWTEYMKTPEHVEYMVFPRLLALSEVLWSPAEARDVGGFAARLERALPRLDALGVGYRIPEPTGVGEDRMVVAEEVEIATQPPVPGWPVLVTLDGTEPAPDAQRWSGGRTLPVPPDGLEVAARVLHPDGRMGPVARSRIRRGRLRPAAGEADALVAERLEPGLRWTRIGGSFTGVTDVAGAVAAAGGAVRADARNAADAAEASRTGAPPTGAASGTVDADPAGSLEGGVVDMPALPQGGPAEHFGLHLGGWIDVPVAGVWTFRLLSDDGSVLTVADTVVVDHDGLHGPTERRGQVALAAGLHRVGLLYFQAGGGSALVVEVEPPVIASGARVRWLHERDRAGAGGPRGRGDGAGREPGTHRP